jgi:hypothetical protein
MRGLRYFIQIAVMAGDILIIMAATYLIWTDPLNLVYWIIVALVFKAWQEGGGFMAWQPKIIREFMRQARKFGL